MHTAEELESLENLHALCSLMQTIRVYDKLLALQLLTRCTVMLNDHAMYEHIMEDDLFYGVVGILECKQSGLLTPGVSLTTSTSRRPRLSGP